jgi:acetyltransferase
MDFFFNPSGIAVIGATPNKLKGGYAIIKNLMTGFKGNIYPINPNYREIEGIPCYPSVKDVPGNIDLGIIFIPAKLVTAALEDCAAKGIPGVMIESGGFGETGSDGQSLQQKIIDIAKKTGIRLWGPNCMGLVDAVHRYAFSFMNPKALEEGLIPGTVSMIVQSGMLSAGFLVDIMTHGTMGISKVCSVGNKVDVNECDLLEYLLGDPHSHVIGFYLESIPQGRRFIEICRDSQKPIVVLKGGKTKKGAEAAISHTASLAGNHQVIAGTLAQAGVIEANDFKQMVDICRSLALVPPRPSWQAGRVAILTFSGGAGIISSDFLEEKNLSLAELSDETKKSLGKLFPDWMPISNPVDLWPAMEKNTAMDIDVLNLAIKAVLADPNVDAIFLHTYAGNVRIRVNLPDAAKQCKVADKPLFVWLLGRRDDAYKFYLDALTNGVPVFQEIYRAVECMAAALQQKRPTKLECSESPMVEPVFPQEDIKAILDKTEGPMDEHISKWILKTHGIPTVEEGLVTDRDTCEKLFSLIGPPVVIKGLKTGATHKTDLGLVYLNITDLQTALATFDSLMVKMEGKGQVLIQRQIDGKLELIIGLLRDPQFGPCVMLGLGGIMAEVLKETVFAMAPLSQHEALELISRLRGRELLDGFRGMPPTDRKKLAEILIKIGNIGIAYPQIKEIDINPLIISKNGPVAVDATIVAR